MSQTSMSSITERLSEIIQRAGLCRGLGHRVLVELEDVGGGELHVCVQTERSRGTDGDEGDWCAGQDIIVQAARRVRAALDVAGYECRRGTWMHSGGCVTWYTLSTIYPRSQAARLALVGKRHVCG
jgi:hypothetical protein